MNRKKISLLVLFIFSITLFNIESYFGSKIQAADDLFRWNRNDTLDTALNIIENKTGDDDILLEAKMEDTGMYAFTYYLEDSRRTTVSFDQQYDSLHISYIVEEIDTTTSPASVTNITQNLIDESYLEMDYDLEVIDWQYIENKVVNPATGALEFTIQESAGAKYPGIAFEIDNKRVILKWDFQSDVLYYLIDGYNKGTIMPLTYNNSVGGSQTIKILKGLDNFQVSPTHLAQNGGNNINVPLVAEPGGDKPGSKPGLELTFNQPKELDVTDWTYKENLTDLTGIKAVVEISDISSDDYLDFIFDLNNPLDTAVKTINELPEEGANGTANDNVVYNYDPLSHSYKINIVNNKSDLTDQNEIIQWSRLQSSKIYNVTIGFQVESGFNEYKFISYIPENNFAYTYMEYELKRANMKEAYLDITPYDVGSRDEVEYTILYCKVITSELDPQDDLWVKHYYSGQDSDENIFIPVPFKGDSSQDVYQIIVDFAGVDIISQVLNYRAIDDFNVPPTTPKIEDIDNLYVVPSANEANSNPSKVKFDLVWDAPENKQTNELDVIFADSDNNPSNDRIYYELLVNDVPTDTTSNPFSVLKVFEVYKDSGEYKVKLHDNISGNATPSSIINYDFGYNSTDELFRMDGINIFDNNTWANCIITDANETTNTYTVTESAIPYDFEFPGVNYIRLRAITEIDGQIGVSYHSIPTSLSLSLIEYDVPIIEGLSYAPKNGEEIGDPVGATIKWRSVAVDTYEDHMLDPIGKTVNTVDYSVYISQDMDAMLQLDPINTPCTSIQMDTQQLVTIDESTIDLLRNDEVITFDLGTSKDLNTLLGADIIGLDENTNYYIRIITKLNIEDLMGSNDEVRYSEPSNMLSITTPIIPKDPDDDELKPLSVENFKVEYADENLISGLLIWDFPEEIIFSQDTYGFEILSIENKALPATLDSRDLMLEDILAAPELTGDNIELWRIYVEADGPVAKKYNSVSGLWENENSAYLSVSDHHIELNDPTNAPNKVYYYYARTVNILNGAVNSASSWQKDTLTTSPVKGPINLVAVYDSQYSYNEKNESIIRFDAPIPEGADLINDYIMEIYVKGEEDDDYMLTKYTSELLGETKEAAIGYTRLYYRISGLKSGNSYSVKVRIEDRTKEMNTLPDGTMAYSKSAFSERTIIRTEFDQGEYDKEIVYEDYLKYFDLKADKLYEQAYFELEKTETKNNFKYRNSYALGELQYHKNGTYDLLAKSAITNVFYLPADFVEQANESKVTVCIETNDHSIGLRPYSIGIDITDEISNMVEDINSYDTNIVDYFIRITVNVGQYKDKINNKIPTSDLLDIQMAVVGSVKSEDQIDKIMINELTTSINLNRMLLTSALSKELEKGIDESKLLALVEKAIEDTKADHRQRANTTMKVYLKNIYTPIKTINKNMFIKLKAYDDEMDNEVYMKKNGLWFKEDSTYYANAYTVENNQLTSYILLPRQLSNSNLEDTFTQEEIDIINQYKLTEVFTVSELSRNTTSISKYQAIAALARLLESGSGYDTIDYLKSNTIEVSSINMYSKINYEESLYLYTQVFAKKHNIELNSIIILDYYIIEDMDDISDDYQEILLIGANLGIVELDNDGRLIPKKLMNIDEFIYLLTKIHNGLNG